MTLQQTLRERAAVPILALAGFAVLAAVLVGFGGRTTLHAPNLSLLADQPLVLKIHMASALAAFVLGLAMFLSRKGHAFHRAAGWTWVALMMTVAGSSLFITGLNGDFYSFIHLLSGWTLISLPFAVWAARRHKVASHRRAMTSLFLGGMVLAGAFTFFPGRLMWEVFFR